MTAIIDITWCRNRCIYYLDNRFHAYIVECSTIHKNWIHPELRAGEWVYIESEMSARKNRRSHFQIAGPMKKIELQICCMCYQSTLGTLVKSILNTLEKIKVRCGFVISCSMGNQGRRNLVQTRKREVTFSHLVHPNHYGYKVWIYKKSAKQGVV